ncbi:octopamine receptor beta-2R-like [Saccostrea echinata]|uniref:octopamine receptor beta-2R-like n=1 Tax=Saccostrea echinata TaxID=191078 RepID=UPI002A83B33F|nr:octopamine receptor beta-2R-like [Saccostrea echinata]XP_061169733.1 octopamine receptor beta-2R-like [Saccostrea echinata]
MIRMNQTLEPSFEEELFNNSGKNLSGTCRSIIDSEDLFHKINTKSVETIFTPTIVYVFLLLILGIPGNVLVVYVYHSWRRSPSRLVIIALAIFDLVNCLFTIPTEIYFIVNLIGNPSPILCKLSRFITFSMNNASSFVLLFIAIDRFKRIYKPLKPPYSNRVTKIVISIGFVIAFLFSWPSLLIYGSQTITIPLPSSNGVCLRGLTCLIDDDVLSTMYPLLFNIILTVGTCIIDLIMICVYVYIGSRSIKAIRETNQFFPKFAMATNDSVDFSAEYSHEVHDPILINGEKDTRYDRKHSAMNGSLSIKSKYDSLDRKGSTVTIASTKKVHSSKPSFAKADRRGRRQMLKSTFMLFLVTVLFIASFIPYCTIVFIRYTNSDHYTNLSNTGKAVYNVFLRSYMLSSALNPVIYSFLSSKFRKQCKRIAHKIFCFGRYV